MDSAERCSEEGRQRPLTMNSGRGEKGREETGGRVSHHWGAVTKCSNRASAGGIATPQAARLLKRRLHFRAQEVIPAALRRPERAGDKTAHDEFRGKLDLAGHRTAHEEADAPEQQRLPKMPILAIILRERAHAQKGADAPDEAGGKKRREHRVLTAADLHTQ